jgi:hypothetical protein
LQLELQDGHQGPLVYLGLTSLVLCPLGLALELICCFSLLPLFLLALLLPYHLSCDSLNPSFLSSEYRFS